MPHVQKPQLAVINQLDTPVLTIDTPGAQGNKYGFEGGRALKLGSTYHLFTSEIVDEPFWVKMKLAHWTSEDRIFWQRASTLYTSTGEFKGTDPRAALWAPIPVFNGDEGRWNLFYTAYRAAPRAVPHIGTTWVNDYEGRIWRASSRIEGIEGIGGPYEDVGIVLEPGIESDPWEGLQGTDSFFPYQVDDTWYALYGSAKTEQLPVPYFRVGLAAAPALAGPWKRCSHLNPLPISSYFVENPIVTKLDDSTYLAVYDNGEPASTIGFTFSCDGIHWTPGESMPVHAEGANTWVHTVRTPLGLIPEGDNLFTLFFTGYQQGMIDLSPWGPHEAASIGLVTVKLTYTGSKL